MGKCGKYSEDSLVMDLVHVDEGSRVGAVVGKFGYHWIFRQCRFIGTGDKGRSVDEKS